MGFWVGFYGFTSKYVHLNFAGTVRNAYTTSSSSLLSILHLLYSRFGRMFEFALLRHRVWLYREISLPHRHKLTGRKQTSRSIISVNSLDAREVNILFANVMCRTCKNTFESGDWTCCINMAYDRLLIEQASVRLFRIRLGSNRPKIRYLNI